MWGWIDHCQTTLGNWDAMPLLRVGEVRKTRKEHPLPMVSLTTKMELTNQFGWGSWGVNPSSPLTSGLMLDQTFIRKILLVYTVYRVLSRESWTCSCYISKNPPTQMIMSSRHTKTYDIERISSILVKSSFFKYYKSARSRVIDFFRLKLTRLLHVLFTPNPIRFKARF